MFTEILTPLISNGTTAFDFNYQPWLPFYNFLPIITVASIAVMLLTHRIFWGIVVFTSSIWALIPTFLMWRNWDLIPEAVFGWWLIHTCLIYAGQISLVRLIRARKKELEKGDPEDAD